jgi:hypothetical protein
MSYELLSCPLPISGIKMVKIQDKPHFLPAAFNLLMFELDDFTPHRIIRISRG